MVQDFWFISLASSQRRGCDACRSKSHFANWQRICLAKFELELCAQMKRCSRVRVSRTCSPLFKGEPQSVKEEIVMIFKREWLLQNRSCLNHVLFPSHRDPSSGESQPYIPQSRVSQLCLRPFWQEQVRTASAQQGGMSSEDYP